MKILFITSTRLGDAVLSTGILSALIRQYPDARITVACGALVESLFKPIPAVERVIALKKMRWYGHWIKLAREVLPVRWDIVVDLRNSALSRILFARKRYIWSAPDDTLHKVEQLADMMRMSPAPAPQLWFDDETLKQAAKIIPGGAPVLGVGPAAKSILKTWEADKFVKLLKHLTAEGAPMQDYWVAVFAAPGEEKAAMTVLNSLPKEKQIDVIAKGNPLLAAACLKRCAFYIGNDSGLMHAAAAVGVPTLGIFGPSKPQHYRPWGAHTSYVTTPETFDELMALKTVPQKSLMGSLQVESVLEVALNLYRRLSV